MMAIGRFFPHLFNNLTTKRLLIKPVFFSTKDSSNSEIDKQESEKSNKPAVTLNPFETLNSTNSAYLNELTLPIKRSFNLAAYVNESETLQELLKLGVSLYDIENTNRKAAQLLLNLDFSKDCAPYIKFLVDNGLRVENLGRFISEFPLIFEHHLEDLQIRINYFEHKKFSRPQIVRGLNKSSHMIAHPTKFIDHKLGQFQIEFRIPPHALRRAVSKYPTIIAIPDSQYKLISFTLFEEFGFKTFEVNRILEEEPSLIEIDRSALIDRLDFLHNTINLSHTDLRLNPQLITGPILEITQRFRYLQKLRRNQFDPRLPLYVPPAALYRVPDQIFCEKFAKTSLEDYKLFIKSR